MVKYSATRPPEPSKVARLSRSWRPAKNLYRYIKLNQMQYITSIYPFYQYASRETISTSKNIVLLFELSKFENLILSKRYNTNTKFRGPLLWRVTVFGCFVSAKIYKNNSCFLLLVSFSFSFVYNVHLSSSGKSWSL